MNSTVYKTDILRTKKRLKSEEKPVNDQTAGFLISVCFCDSIDIFHFKSQTWVTAEHRTATVILLH